MSRIVRWSSGLIATVCFLAGNAGAVEVRFESVVEDVYAFVGDTGPRTTINEGLNANIGLVVTQAGAVLIDSGATFNSARQIHEAVRRVTPQPVRWVVNTGDQDHRWLGNGYFKAQGAEIMAHAVAETDMRSQTRPWLATFAEIERLAPVRIAPVHGRVTDRQSNLPRT